ncbi:MAG: prepilin-type N-terminal cleavage/methylation domain-containing protein [Gemmatimonadales bacterium]|nr:prepilin-type N-terminal cleavage/methylation domain-containing protein [Gemmatimonadales bacterium]MBA3556032.1 prepilin-type N-terminal cleavage/methylation domain-containing protein [Gemmatimonadales bacterium]
MKGARRGFTLVELMIGLVFTMGVAGTIHRLLLVNHWVGRSQVEHAGMQDNVRAGALITAHELRDLGFDSVPALAELDINPAASSDVLVAQPGRIRYRGTQGFGFTCSTPTIAELRLRAATYEGLRGPVAGVDSVMMFVEGNSELSADDAWVRAGVAATATGNCTDGTPGIVVSTSWAAAGVGATAAARMVAGGPVRIFEVLELQYYAQGGQSWLGMRSVSRGENIQPLIGPLADSTGTARGFVLGYLDQNDAPAAALNDIRTITIGLRGVTAQPVRPVSAGYRVVDTLSLTTRVALRNMRRP